MSGSLMQLVAMTNYNNMPQQYEITPQQLLTRYSAYRKNIEKYNNQATELSDLTFGQINPETKTCQLILPLTGDGFRPDYIIINTNQPNQLRLTKYNIKINGNEAWNIDINFLQQHFQDVIDVRQDKIIYKAYFDKFIEDGYIPIINFTTQSIELEFDGDISLIESCKVFGTNVFYDYQKRHDITSGNYSPLNMVQLNQSNSITTQQSEININMNAQGQVNGIFIETDNINNITGLKLTLNGLHRIDITQQLQIELYCQKIGNLLYLSLSHLGMWNLQYNSRDHLNLSRISDIKIKILSSGPIGHVRLYTLVQNIVLHHVHYSINGLSISVHDSSVSVQPNNQPIIYTFSFSDNIIVKKYVKSDICPISLEEIVEGTEYCECDKCHKAFIKQYLMEWINNQKKCPHCRELWTSPIVYRNDEVGIDIEMNTVSVSNQHIIQV